MQLRQHPNFIPCIGDNPADQPPQPVAIFFDIRRISLGTFGRRRVAGLQRDRQPGKPGRCLPGEEESVSSSTTNFRKEEALPAAARHSCSFCLSAFMPLDGGFGLMIRKSSPANHSLAMLPWVSKAKV